MRRAVSEEHRKGRIEMERDRGPETDIPAETHRPPCQAQPGRPDHRPMVLREPPPRLLRWRAAFVLGIAGMLFLLWLPSSEAQGNPSKGGVPALEARVAALEAQVSQLLVTNSDQAAAIAALQQALADESVARTAAESALGAQIVPLRDLFLAPNPVTGGPYLQRQGNDFIFTGANVHLRNGLGATNGNPGAHPFEVDPAVTAINGLGNLIVGYNEDVGHPRTGSHSIVVGAWHGWESFGGVVAGFWNRSTGPYATVTAGQGNTASGPWSSVSGGGFSTASGAYSAIGGGTQNEASGNRASVSGGHQNLASGFATSVSGGRFNVADGDGASVSGGSGSSATGFSSWVGGGGGHTASGSYSSVAGGSGNTASGHVSAVGGGLLRSAPGESDWVAGSLFEDF